MLSNRFCTRVGAAQAARSPIDCSAIAAFSSSYFSSGKITPLHRNPIIDIRPAEIGGDNATVMLNLVGWIGRSRSDNG
jgi:hypothetical protein